VIRRIGSGFYQSGAMSWLFVLVVGVLGGLAGAFQSQFLGVMEDRVGTLASTFITYGGGGLVIAVAMVAFERDRFSELRTLPWWVFTAGLMGLLVVASLGITVSRLGLGAGLTLFTAATLILGAIIEHLGWFGSGRTIDAIRAGGIALVIVGTWLVVRA
jgi:bacterial/archaeal transporter family-2 protein